MTDVQLVVYEGEDEVLITVKGPLEAKMIKEWFTEGERNLNDYDRWEVSVSETAIRRGNHSTEEKRT